MASPVVDKGSKSPNTPAQVDYKAKLDEAAEGEKKPPDAPDHVSNAENTVVETSELIQNTRSEQD